MIKPLRRTVLVAVLLGTLIAQATGPGPDYVPIPRLIQNLSTAIQTNPKDAESHYLLGRVHYFAFMAPQNVPQEESTPPDSLGIYQSRRAERFGFDGGPDSGTSTNAIPRSYTRTPEQQIAHVREAVIHLKKALLLRGERPQKAKKGLGDYDYAMYTGVYEICLACALEEGAKYAPQVGELFGLPPTPDAWRAVALRYYLLTYQRSIQRDSHLEHRFVGSKLISEEAGLSYRRLLRERGSVTAAEENRLARMKKTLEPLKKLPAYITPIVFSLKPQTGLSSLLDSHKQVRFNLDGTGRRQQLSWVGPETAILCWDPARTGKITSGKQLFGSVTWWMFWRDGYAAMAALDDNHDGWLAGHELAGLALWFDRNQDGVSGPGEVIPLAQTPVVGLATMATDTEQGSPRSAAGLRLRDGTTLPTWDWTVLDRPG